MRYAWLAAAAVGAVLCGCTRPTLPAAVKVNGQPIAMAEIRRVLATQGAAGRRLDAAQVMDGLIDEELLAQKARKLRLDERPEVRLVLDAMTRELLARAYIEQISASGAGEDVDKVRAFYRANPDLFQHRRVYRIAEVAVAVPDIDASQFRAIATSEKGLTGLARWLKQSHVPFTFSTWTKAAEEIPPGVLPLVASMHDGDVNVVPSPQGVSVIQLVASQDAPLDEEQAKPAIAQRLTAPRQREYVASELKALRAASRIDYLVDLGQKVEPPPAAPEPSPLDIPLF